MLQRDNLSVVLYGVDDLRLEQSPMPDKPLPDEVQLATHTVGICGSDISYWKKGRIAEWAVKEPIISGHEASAVVIAVGENVKNLKSGDRVAVEPGISCMKCKECFNGQYNLCAYVSYHASPSIDGSANHGSLRRYFNHPAAFCHKIPDNVSFGEGALIEPLAIAVYACKKAGIQIGFGQKVLVSGAGPIGLLAALSARAMGAENVLITDIDQKRLDIAEKLGLSVLLINTNNESTLEKQVLKILGGKPDSTLECSGAESSIRLGILVTKDGGNVILLGFGPHNVSIPLSSASTREINLLGIKRCSNTYPLAIQLVSTSRINIKPLITHVFRLEEALEAFEVARSQRDGAIKVHIQCANEKSIYFS